MPQSFKQKCDYWWRGSVRPLLGWRCCRKSLGIGGLRHMSETCCRWLAENTGRKKSPNIAIWAPSHNFIGLYLRKKGTYRQSEKNLLSSNMSSTCPHNMVNFGLLAAEIGLPVSSTPPNFNGLRVLAALLQSSKVVSVSQTLRRRTEGATYVRQGDHHAWHWPTFLVIYILAA